MPSLHLDPDRLFPADAPTRAIARELHALVAELPILSPHGHVDPRLLVEDAAFADPANLLIRYDHYVTRLLHAAGIGLERLGVPSLVEPVERRTEPVEVTTPRETWRLFCSHWHLFAGTASGFWLTSELVELFGVDEQPSAESADRIFERIEARLREPDFRPRALFDRFNVEVLATTDDPMDDLAAHTALAKDSTFKGRALPTFRPDPYLDPEAAGFAERVERLGASSYQTYLDALADRRQYFIRAGAVSADHGVLEPYTLDLPESDAAELFGRALQGSLDPAEARAFRGHMLLQMARMSVDDGLVMTVHAGVRRNHSTTTFERFGPDTGHDLPVATTFVDNLRPLLERFGTIPDFHLVLFSVDETVYSRELAPLAGFYPSVYLGAPWWFLDAPDAALRFRAAVTETAGFYRGSGFIDDTRAFLSIPARHDMARRLDAAFLARLVREGRIDLATAQRVAVDLVDAIPRKAFKL